MRAESWLAAGSGNAPTEDAALTTAGLPPQLSFWVTMEVPERIWSCGLASVPVTPKVPSVGPTPRMRSFLAVLPVTTKPATSRP